MKDYGFKVSREGYDVRAADDSQLALTSALLSERIAGTALFTHHHTATTSATTTVTHNLGYPGQFRAFDTTNSRAIPHLEGESGGGFFSIEAYVTATTIVFRSTSDVPITASLVITLQLLYNSII